MEKVFVIIIGGLNLHQKGRLQKKQEEMKRNALLLFLWTLTLFTNVSCASKSREKTVFQDSIVDPYIALKLLVLKN